MPYKDPEKNKEAIAKWHAEHRKESNLAVRNWQKRNREEWNEYRREWNAKNPEKVKEYARKSRQNNHEETLARTKKWQANHPEACKIYCRNRNALRKGGNGTYKPSDIATIYDAQEGRCYYCDEVLDQTYHVDHKQPTSRGGSNWPENLCVTCPTCNMRKHAQTEAEFVLRQFAGSPCST